MFVEEIKTESVVIHKQISLLWRNLTKGYFSLSFPNLNVFEACQLCNYMIRNQEAKLWLKQGTINHKGTWSKTWQTLKIFHRKIIHSFLGIRYIWGTMNNALTWFKVSFFSVTYNKFCWLGDKNYYEKELQRKMIFKAHFKNQSYSIINRRYMTAYLDIMLFWLP